MRRFSFLLLFFCFFSFVSPLWAETGYIGEDLGNDIYKRIDEWVYRVKKQLVEVKTKKNIEIINREVGASCKKKVKEGEKSQNILCFRAGVDFTISDFEAIRADSIGPIYTHLSPDTQDLTTDDTIRIAKIIADYYNKSSQEVTDDAEKMQSIASIGLFTDGNSENSSYDLMVDLRNIHDVLFARTIPYEGTSNLGKTSLANLLKNGYGVPKPLSPDTSGTGSTSSGSLDSSSGSVTLSWVLDQGQNCRISPDAPSNLDNSIADDIASQLSSGTNSKSYLSVSDDSHLPEYWARMGGSTWGAGPWLDKFPCSGKDFFCIIVSFTKYGQDILSWGKADTIESVLDENLKIVNAFAGSSFVLTKMPILFFGSPFKNFNLPSMVHLRVSVSKLPPPILNLKKSPGEKDEFKKILIGTFEESGIDYKRQNSLEDNLSARWVGNLTYLTTDQTNEKLDTSESPKKVRFTQAMNLEIRKSYGDSFNDDLFELWSFTQAFSEKITVDLTSLIKSLNAIPQSK